MSAITNKCNCQLSMEERYSCSVLLSFFCLPLNLSRSESMAFVCAAEVMAFLAAQKYGTACLPKWFSTFSAKCLGQKWWFAFGADDLMLCVIAFPLSLKKVVLSVFKTFRPPSSIAKDIRAFSSSELSDFPIAKAIRKLLRFGSWPDIATMTSSLKWPKVNNHFDNLSYQFGYLKELFGYLKNTFC